LPVTRGQGIKMVLQVKDPIPPRKAYVVHLRENVKYLDMLVVFVQRIGVGASKNFSSVNVKDTPPAPAPSLALATAVSVGY